jgi:hypothetical protein
VDTFWPHRGRRVPNKLRGSDVSVYGPQMGPGIYYERWLGCSVVAPLGNSRSPGTERISAVWVAWFGLLVHWCGNYVSHPSVKGQFLGGCGSGMLLFQNVAVSRVRFP